MVSKYITMAVALGLLVQIIAAQSTTSWGVTNRQITKDGQPFLVKGVNYAPMPPGAIINEQTQWGDLFHTQWSHLHDRDIPLMREAGVNAIRIYQIQIADPLDTTKNLDHATFFDKLWNNGDHPIYVLITYAIGTPFTYLGPFDTQPTTGDSWQDQGKWWQIDQTQEAKNKQERDIERNIVEAIAKEYGKHPAVMGFVIGNEQNNAQTRANCQFWAWIDEIATLVKAAAPGKLTATTIVDDDFLTVKAAVACNDLTNLDVWGINAYRGRVDTGFDNLFDDFAANTNTALLITEFGCPASTRDNGKFVMMPDNSKPQGEYLKVHWEDMVAHQSICSGGFAFSWVDEWWKLNEASQQDQHDTPNGAFPGGFADEESYGLVALNVDCTKLTDWATRVDPALPRAVYFMMGQMFGGFTTMPEQALLPINYPRCNGEWVGTPNAPNAVTPVDPQQPVTSVPIGAGTPSVIATPVAGTNNDNTSSASGVACSVAVVALSLIALIF
jgi:hypothetical protein